MDLGPLGSPRYRYGSGCIVSGRTVLTAGHVVAGAHAAWMRSTDKIRHELSLDVRFVGGGPGPDLALLDVDHDVSPLPPLQIGVFSRVGARADVSSMVHAIGYPSFKEHANADDAVRDTEHVVGFVPVLSNLVTGVLTVQVTSAPRPLPPTPAGREASPWAGMSGAPLFTDHYLIGVISLHAPAEGSSAITATPLSLIDRSVAHPGWGSGFENGAEWWAKLGVMDPARLHRIRSDRKRRVDGRAAVAAIRRVATTKGIDAATAEEHFCIREHEEFVSAVDLTGGGQLLATGGHDGTIRVWNVEDGVEIARYEQAGKVSDVHFARCGTRLAACSADGRIRLLALDAPRLTLEHEIEFPFPGETAPPPRISWSPDERFIVLAHGELSIYDLQKRGSVRQLQGRHRKFTDLFAERGTSTGFSTCCFSPDGSMLATGARDRTARLWLTADWSLLFEVDHIVGVGMYSNVPVTGIAFANHAGWMITASGRSQQLAWSCRTGKEVGHYRQAWPPISRFAESVDTNDAGTRVVFGNQDGSALVWDVIAQTPLRMASHSSHAVVSTAISNSGDVVATAGGDARTAIVWRAR